jgi:hypothetical protein
MPCLKWLRSASQIGRRNLAYRQAAIPMMSCERAGQLNEIAVSDRAINSAIGPSTSM